MASWLSNGIRLPLVLGAAALMAYAMFFANPYDLRVLTHLRHLCAVGARLSVRVRPCWRGLACASDLLRHRRLYHRNSGDAVWLSVPGDVSVVDRGPALLAVIIAVPVLKLEEHYFSLATLGIGLVVLLLAIQWSDVTGGTNGLAGIPAIELSGFTIADRRSVLWFVWAIVAIGCLIAYQVTRGLHGQAYHLMRENREAASSLGLNIAELRFGAFVLSAAYGGAAGALMAHVIHVVSPENLDLALMVTCLTMTVIGGRTRIAGAILGATLIVYLREWFRVLENYYMIAYGTAALAVLIVAPYGLVGALDRLRVLLFGVGRVAPPPASLPPIRSGKPTATHGEHRADHDRRRCRARFRWRESARRRQPLLSQGEIVGLIGPNGSGKTTLLNVISGLASCQRGSVTFLGHDITKSPAYAIARLGISRTFQHIHLADDLSVLDNIAVARAGIDGGGLLQAIGTIGHDRRLKTRAQIALAAAERLEHRRRCDGAVRPASLRHATAGRSGARARHRAALVAPRRASGWPQRAGAKRLAEPHSLLRRRGHHCSGRRTQSCVSRRAGRTPDLS